MTRGPKIETHGGFEITSTTPVMVPKTERGEKKSVRTYSNTNTDEQNEQETSNGEASSIGAGDMRFSNNGLFLNQSQKKMQLGHLGECVVDDGITQNGRGPPTEAALHMAQPKRQRWPQLGRCMRMHVCTYLMYLCMYCTEYPSKCNLYSVPFYAMLIIFW